MQSHADVEATDRSQNNDNEFNVQVREPKEMLSDWDEDADSQVV